LRVILIKIDTDADLAGIHTNYPPVGLVYIGSALEEAGYDIQVNHIATTAMESYGKNLHVRETVFFGFSVFTGSCIKASLDLSRMLKRKCPNIPIVWGGVHPSCMPEQCLADSCIDVVCIGEGEETAVELAQAIEGKREFASVRGIAWRTSSGALAFNPPRPFAADLDRFKMNWSLLDMERYIIPFNRFRRTISIVSSRGCPHACSFCYNQSFHHRKWRAHSVAYMIEQAGALIQEYRIEAVRFRDDNFFTNRDRAFEIVEKLDIPFFASARVDYVDRAFVTRLNRTRCFQLFFGFESGSDRILGEVLEKGVSVRTIISAVQMFARCNSSIQITGLFMFAIPTETYHEFLQTIRLSSLLLDIYPKLSFGSGVYRPYPGTPLYRMAIESGFQPPRKTEAWDTVDWLGYGAADNWAIRFGKRRFALWGKYLEACAFSCRNRLFPLSMLLKWRVRNQIFAFPVDLMLVSFLSLFVNRYGGSRWVLGLKKLFTSSSLYP
jgi:anaerobic magnesium-protoporphyrin IX monomethyl ester cyclase